MNELDVQNDVNEGKIRESNIVLHQLFQSCCNEWVMSSKNESASLKGRTP
jgi:hypothetical protein